MSWCRWWWGGMRCAFVWGEWIKFLLIPLLLVSVRQTRWNIFLSPRTSRKQQEEVTFDVQQFGLKESVFVLLWSTRVARCSQCWFILFHRGVGCVFFSSPFHYELFTESFSNGASMTDGIRSSGFTSTDRMWEAAFRNMILHTIHHADEALKWNDNQSLSEEQITLDLLMDLKPIGKLFCLY